MHPGITIPTLQESVLSGVELNKWASKPQKECGARAMGDGVSQDRKTCVKALRFSRYPKQNF